MKNQAMVLAQCKKKADDIFYLINKIQSGDIGNIEGVAARKYWKRLFGNDFVRNFDAPGINGMLNFGYAVLRSTVSRFIVGSGLNPSLGIFHHNKLNPWCLADDLMEPYRPFIDFSIFNMANKGIVSLDRDSKKILSELFDHKFAINECSSSLKNCIYCSVISYWKSINNKRIILEYPDFAG